MAWKPEDPEWTGSQPLMGCVTMEMVLSSSMNIYRIRGHILVLKIYSLKPLVSLLLSVSIFNTIISLRVIIFHSEIKILMIIIVIRMIFEFLLVLRSYGLHELSYLMKYIRNVDCHVHFIRVKEHIHIIHLVGMRAKIHA